MKARILPKNISAHPDGYLVRIERNKMLYQAFVKSSTPAALDRAVELRDNFLTIAGPVKIICRPGQQKPRSNTGISGITETIKWVRYSPRYCFIVYLGKHHRPQNKRIYFGRSRTRDQALKRAIALRLSLRPSHLALPQEVSNA